MVRSSGSHCFANLLMQRLGKWNRVHQDRDVPLHQRQLKARIKVLNLLGECWVSRWWIVSTCKPGLFNVAQNLTPWADGNVNSYLVTPVTSLLLHKMFLYGFLCLVVHPTELLYQCTLNKTTMQLGQDKLKITSRTSYWKINYFWV